MTRRTFALTALAAAQTPTRKRPEVCVFSKHLAQFDWNGTGKTAKQIGFDGVDLTVRPKGHVVPEQVAQDLPKALEAIRAHNLTVPMITTDLTSASQSVARPTLSTAARHKVPLFKVGYWRYRPGTRVETYLAECRSLAQGITALAKETGTTAGLHNHSGDYVGAPVWDYRELIRDCDPRHMGFYYDPGHATVEGGLSGWKFSLEVALERLKMVAIKDFYWEKRTGKWTTQWCPLGEGMVNWQAVFAALAKAGFTGPLTLHLEYETKDELEAMAKDYAFLRRHVDAAYAPV